jgi:class 3 adenylate cyclase/tetratricopeptide (TPR) repeat protein
MKCPQCQTENPETRKFCRQCGARLVLICPHCRCENLPADKFCGECGQRLAVSSEPLPQAPSFEEKLDKIQRAMPDGLTEKVLAQRGSIEGERKQVTVMFCDIVGFSALSERLGPEEVYSIMDEVFEILIHRVHTYGGTVNRMTGMMALFGAPIAVEDAPQRAIRAALSIHREMARFSERHKRQRELSPLKMRIGIHTGPVVVSTLGNDLRVEFTSEGDTVEIASRMEGLAEPGTTYVSEATFKLTEGYFRFEALGEREVGKEGAALKAYRVIAPSTIRTRFDVSAERGLTPFVGREKELELLLDGFERARGGRGQAFSIMGEAGVGKSRLLYEFRKAITHEDMYFLEGRCLSYGGGVAYHPIIDIFKSTFDIREGDKDNQVRDKVKKGLKETGIDEASTLPYVLELLSVKDSGIDKIPMSGAARRDRMMEAWKRLMLGICEMRPLVIAIEDLHWTDKSSEEALKHLLEGMAGAQLLLIFTYRPEFVHTWGAKGYHSQLNLNRLSNRESLAMVTYLLGTEEIEPVLETMILEKTEGIPFFIEEMIRSLKDLGIIKQKGKAYYLTKDIGDVTIPGTVQDVIMARVDTLPDAAKGVLQIGAVIEREFSYEVTKQVAGIAEQELLSHLSLLKDAELVYERGVYPHSNYIFRHALTREVVYDSIPAARKKQLHVAIGNAIEKSYRDNRAEHYEVLAGHYVIGEEYTKGAEHCQLAASKAEDMGSLPDAIAYGEKRIACLERLPRTDEVEKDIIDARTTLGLYDMHMGYVVEAKEAVEPVVDLAVKRDDKRRISQIYSILGNHAITVEEDFPKAFEYLEDALKIAEELNDTPSLLEAHHWLGIGLGFVGEFQKSLDHLEKALEINVATNTLWAIAETKAHISAFPYAWGGKVDLAYQTTGEIVRIAEESGDIFSKANVYLSNGYSCYCKGFLKEAEERLLKAVDLSERFNNFVFGGLASWFLGDTHFDRSEYGKAQDAYQKGLSLLERTSCWVYIRPLKIASAMAKVMNNQRDIDLHEIFKYYDENRAKIWEGWLARYIGEIMLTINDKHMDEAEAWVTKAIEADTRNGMPFDLGKAHALYAKLLKRKGDLSAEKKNLKKAAEIYQACGADGWVKKTEEALAET